MYCIKKSEFLDHAKKNADVMFQIARGLSEHYDDMLGRINAVEQSDLRSKILYVLHNLCERLDGSSVVQLDDLGLHVTHQDIADMIGSTRESASIELKKLRDQKLIDYTRSSFTIYFDKICKELEIPV